jgi:hypothetical protein
MHPRKLLVASAGIAAAYIACSNDRTVGNGMGTECDSCLGPFDTGVLDSAPDASMHDGDGNDGSANDADAAESSTLDAGDAGG